MYTEISLECKLKKDTPEEIITLLKNLCTENKNNTDIKEDVLKGIVKEHQFFRCQRWDMVFCGVSYYFNAQTRSALKEDYLDNGEYYLSIRSNLKNYDSEIEHFLDFISPFVDAYTDEHLGHVRYEENDIPTLLFYKKEKIVSVTPEEHFNPI